MSAIVMQMRLMAAWLVRAFAETLGGVGGGVVNVSLQTLAQPTTSADGYSAVTPRHRRRKTKKGRRK